MRIPMLLATVYIFLRPVVKLLLISVCEHHKFQSPVVVVLLAHVFNDSLPEVLPLLFTQLCVGGKDLGGRAVRQTLSQNLLILDQELCPLQQLSPLETLQYLPTFIPQSIWNSIYIRTFIPQSIGNYNTYNALYVLYFTLCFW